jgi:hypothetical protein
MSALNLSEQDAFRRLQLTARERNLRLADVAARIVEQQSLLEPKRNDARLARTSYRAVLLASFAAFETTPREAKAASSELLRPEGKANGLDSFNATTRARGTSAPADTPKQAVLALVRQARASRSRPARRSEDAHRVGADADGRASGRDELLRASTVKPIPRVVAASHRGSTHLRELTGCAALPQTTSTRVSRACRSTTRRFR